MKSARMTGNNIVLRIFRFYRDGFSSMTVGRQLWLIIFIKLFIMFAILKLFFFRNFLDERFESDDQKSRYVIEQITNLKQYD